ncbi:MAG: deaminase [Candidatus Pacebacteria bacterium]|nr:deaminase [Candidatus Paceibacterota bacterium]MDR3583378.1 deaminase [Candidatus Paceibacterota bacterium]
MPPKKILIALVPVIHIKYLELFKKYPDHLYILDDTILKKWDKFENLKRDLRTIDQETICNFVKKSGLVKKIDLLKPDKLKDITDPKEDSPIVMPNEDVSHWFAEKFLQDKKVKFENVFLRWNRPVSTQELEVSSDRITTQEKAHQELIGKADELKEKSANWWRQIGALVTDAKGSIILSAFNRHVPTQENMAVYGDLRMCFDAGENHHLSNSIHAEASLIGKAAKDGISLNNTNLYVTTFPCPTCAKLVAEAGIKKVYYQSGYSLSDAEDILKNAGVEIILVK